MSTDQQRLTGTVKFFSESKGFGFIERPDADDVFVHSKQVADGVTLRQGNRVNFLVEQGHKGPRALDVKLVDG